LSRGKADIEKADIEHDSGASAAVDQLGTAFLLMTRGAMPDVRNAYKTAIIFQQPTVYLSELQAHLTTMLPKAGYEPVRDQRGLN
jgi:hypothetical protein